MSCPEFVARSMGLRIAAHLAHLSTTSYAEHVALGEFYPALDGLTDRYAEVYMGLNKRPSRWPPVSVPRGDPVELLREYLRDIKDEMAEDHGSEAMQNILAELEELTGQTIYKLVNLK
jgi:hypothetical protein